MNLPQKEKCRQAELFLVLSTCVELQLWLGRLCHIPFEWMNFEYCFFLFQPKQQQFVMRREHFDFLLFLPDRNIRTNDGFSLLNYRIFLNNLRPGWTTDSILLWHKKHFLKLIFCFLPNITIIFFWLTSKISLSQSL